MTLNQVCLVERRERGYDGRVLGFGPMGAEARNGRALLVQDHFFRNDGR